MCGIFGYIGFASLDLKKHTSLITYRGPDGEGYLTMGEDWKIHLAESALEESWKPGFKTALGFRRLAIIDLAPSANQPFVLQEHHCAIIFNGEIYNYIELRDQLTKLGQTFQTASDTEVLLRSYLQWGEKCVTQFNGMWAFAIADFEKKKLFCSRDRFGIKPFFYHTNHLGTELVFGSEIKQIHSTGVNKKINENILSDFLVSSVNDHTADTFFQGVHHLPAGCNLSVDLALVMKTKRLKIQIQRYWNLTPNEDDGKLTYPDACRRFSELFESSVRLRFRSDVPVGTCLSGGLDSSSIVCLAAKRLKVPVHSFTSNSSEKQFDESTYVKIVGEMYPKIQQKYCSLNEDIFLSELEKVIFHQDEPFGTLSILAQWEVMKLAKKHGVSVLLDGQGGDEILAGYRKYYAFFLKELLHRCRFGKFFQEGIFLLKNKELAFFNKEGIFRYFGLKRHVVGFLSEQGKRLPAHANIYLSSANSLREKSRHDVEMYSFPPLLRYEDRNSMAHSIEARVPFMDFRLVQFLHSLPSEYLIRKGYTKSILRDALVSDLPTAIRLRRSKLGFATPQSIWMGKKLNQHFKSYFQQMDNPYLNAKVINSEFEKYPGSLLDSFDFSRFYIFDRWFQIHFGTTGLSPFCYSIKGA
jgi:asparagine synthase (glutamine-hydrolysing)